MFKQAFERQRHNLANEITLSQLMWDALLDYGVLSRENIQFLRNNEKCPTDYHKITEMMNILDRKDDKKFEPFLIAIAVSGDNTQVVRELKKKLPQEKRINERDEKAFHDMKPELQKHLKTDDKLIEILRSRDIIWDIDVENLNREGYRNKKNEYILDRVIASTNANVLTLFEEAVRASGQIEVADMMATILMIHRAPLPPAGVPVPDETQTSNSATVSGDDDGRFASLLCSRGQENYEFDLNIDNLKDTEKDFYDKYKDEAYPMTSSPRGKVLIINVYKTDGTDRHREGTIKHAQQLKELFERLHFYVIIRCDVTDRGSDVPAKVKPTATNIPVFIAQATEQMTETDQCFILITMSHGGINEDEQDEILACDGLPVRKDHILDQLRDCEKLRGKPRLVFFQCCRNKDNVPLVMKTERYTDCQRIDPDTLYYHTCTREFLSFRPLFVRALVDTFVKHAHEFDVVTMMKRVKELVSSDKFDGKYDQIPELAYDPNMKNVKRLFFFPGIIE